MAKQFTENLRFLVWKDAGQGERKQSQKERDRWPQTVARWIGCTPARGRELLWEIGKPAQLEEMEALARYLDRILDEIASKRLLQPEEILAHNIAYLFDGLDHGSKGDFARAIGVDISTISRWRRLMAKPSRVHLTRLCEQFALDAGIDLESTPLFLSPTPVSLAQRRDWLKQKIEVLSPRDMSDLFPALRLLLGGSHAGD